MEKDEYDLFRRQYPEILHEVVGGALEAAGLHPRDVALLLPHNVNRLSWARLSDVLQIPAERTYLDNIARTGHCFCADPFLNYRTVTELGLLSPGDHYVMVSVGLGATFSAMVFQH
jgi:3-oxoacyl-[acyl-carrier-protein] synthase-3